MQELRPAPRGHARSSGGPCGLLCLRRRCVRGGEPRVVADDAHDIDVALRFGSVGGFGKDAGVFEERADDELVVTRLAIWWWRKR